MVTQNPGTPLALELCRLSNDISDASAPSQNPQSSSYEDSLDHLVEDIQLHLILPPSSVAREVTVTLSPKKMSHGSPSHGSQPTQALTTYHSATSHTQPPGKFEPSSCAPDGSINDVSHDLVLRPAYIPVHLRYDTADLPDHERFAVTPQMLMNNRVPDLSSSGGKKRAWYVVIRGLEIGIFMDYW